MKRTSNNNEHRKDSVFQYNRFEKLRSDIARCKYPALVAIFALAWIFSMGGLEPDSLSRGLVFYGMQVLAGLYVLGAVVRYSLRQNMKRLQYRLENHGV